MNLHEECLLKYLSNPVGLSISTELLKFNNSLIEKTLLSSTCKKAKLRKIACSATRI